MLNSAHCMEAIHPKSRCIRGLMLSRNCLLFFEAWSIHTYSCREANLLQVGLQAGLSKRLTDAETHKKLFGPSERLSERANWLFFQCGSLCCLFELNSDSPLVR